MQNCCNFLSERLFKKKKRPNHDANEVGNRDHVLQRLIAPTSKPANPRPPLAVFASVRFNMIDVYACATSGVARERRRYEIMYRKSGDVAWTDCPRNEIKVVPGNVGRLCTITNLQPLTTYEVRAELTLAADEETIAESETLRVTTSQPMVFEKVYKAVETYETNSDLELSVRIGDLLREEREEPTEDLSIVPANYIYLRLNLTDRCGYVPTYAVRLAEEHGRPVRIVNHECFFNINRQKATTWLIRPNVLPGRFIVRPSSEASIWALSGRFGVDEEGFPLVYHYKIHSTSDGYGCFISPTQTFEDITQLISHFQTNFLSVRTRHLLTEPFPRIPVPPTLEEISIPTSHVIITELLGCGNFGEVYKGKLYGFEVAVKKLPREADYGARALSRKRNRALLQEAEAMASLFHENVVRIIGVCVDTNETMIVTELMNYGTLWHYLNDDSKVADIQLKEVLFFLSEVASGMAYLEDKNVVHRDLRSANILVHDEGGILEVKIADFGLTRRVESDDENIVYTRSKIPLRWTAPESLMKLEFSEKSDVWSFGILFYETVTLGALPYKDFSNEEIFGFVTNGGAITLRQCRENKRVPARRRTLPDEELCPDPLFNQMSRCWRSNPKERPTFSALFDLLVNYETTSDYYYVIE